MSARAAARADRLAERLVLRGFSAGKPGVVLIDGGAGSGKTTLANRLARRLGAELVHLDHLYPGWEGLAAGALAAETEVLDRGRYRRYDWEHGELAEWVTVSSDGPLIVEGCGAITAGTMAAARRRHPDLLSPVVAIWVECPEFERRARALERDGEMFRPHWDQWARQEAAHRRQHRPLACAREIVHTGGERGNLRPPDRF